jgi:hypothetical protein
MSGRAAGSNGRRAGARPAPPARGGGRRISPVAVFLGVAVIGSVVYMAYAVTVREASQIPLLASGLVVLAIVFGALACYCLRETWRAGAEGRGRRAMVNSIIGGVAAMVAAICVAFAIIGFQVASLPA